MKNYEIPRKILHPAGRPSRNPRGLGQDLEHAARDGVRKPYRGHSRPRRPMPQLPLRYYQLPPHRNLRNPRRVRLILAACLITAATVGVIAYDYGERYGRKFVARLVAYTLEDAVFESKGSMYQQTKSVTDKYL